MKKPLYVVAVGDIHTGSTYAVHPEPSNDIQASLLGAWNKMVTQIKQAARGHDLVLMLGGDLVEGQQGRTHQSRGNSKEQRDLAVELIQPLANLAAYAYGITGTEAHAGDDGCDDASVYEVLGVEYANGAADLEVGRHLIDWAHHGASVSPVLRNETNGLVEKAKRVVERAQAEKRKVPSHLIRHHAHRAPQPVFVGGVWAAVCPCWQASTGYGKKVADGIQPTIGWLDIDPASGQLRRHVVDGVLTRKAFKV